MSNLPAMAVYRILGTLGAAILACAGWSTGALLIDDSRSPAWLAEWRHNSGPALLCGYLGLTLMTIAWWLAGREIRRHGGPDRRGLLVTLACWSSPLLVGPPMFSRDVYSYLAQGSMVLTNIDVYRFGVSRVGGPLAAEVPDVWQHTPAPYGPVFLGLAALVAAAMGTKIMLGILGLRLVALCGVGLLAVFLPRLARRCGVDPAAALWLGVLNPLVPLHLIAGAHNDAVMLGLLVAGLYAASRNRFVLATILVTLAALVKVPAAVGLLVVATLWASHRHRVSTLLLTLGIAATTTAVVSTATGIGYGWVAVLGTPISEHSWSLSSALGRASNLALRALGFEFGDAPMRFWLWFGMLVAVGAAALAWWHRGRLGPTYVVGLVLISVALLGPATRPWYALWGLVPLAASAPDGRVRQLAAVGACALAFLVLPSGSGPNQEQLMLAAVGVLLGIAAAAYVRMLSTIVPAPLAELPR